MNKILVVLLLLLILLLVACRGGNQTWQASSATAPQFEEQPRLFLRPRTGFSHLSTLAVAKYELNENEQPLTLAPSLGSLLTIEYQVLTDILIGEGGRYIGLPNGATAAA